MPPKVTPSSEKEWPVRVYRQITTNAPGKFAWQRLVATRQSSKKRVVVKAAPRKDCIVLRRLQIRIRLVLSDNDTTTTPLRLTVTRRRRRILISSNHKLKVLMLKFQSERDCLAFGDELVALNPMTVPTARSNNNNSNANNVLFYVSRLLHDPDFANFCQRLESSLVSTPDGLKALQALAAPEQDDESNNKASPEERSPYSNWDKNNKRPSSSNT